MKSGAAPYFAPWNAGALGADTSSITHASSPGSSVSSAHRAVPA